jgi:hypothetical protein
MRACDRMLVLLVGLFNSPRGNQAWLRVHLPLNTPINEALEWARTRPSEASRKASRHGEREIDPYADSIIASGDYAFYSEV